ncbi:MAG: acetolactate decarboxylase [Campylobacterales bacterium]
MKVIAFLTLFMSSLLFAEFKHYGNFSNMIKTRDLSGVVDISTLKLEQKGVYALGAMSNAKGEITIFDGNVYLSYGDKGVDKTYSTIPKSTKAMLLATIKPEKFSTKIEIEHDMSDVDFYLFGELEEMAKKSGIDIEKPFLFVLDGEFSNILWHIIDGKNHKIHSDDKRGKLMKKLFVSKKSESGIIYGVYSKNSDGVFTHPGENYHAHGVFSSGEQAGHIDEFTIKANTTLRLAQ